MTHITGLGHAVGLQHFQHRPDYLADAIKAFD